MFKSLILEARAHLSKRKRKRDLDERPEINAKGNTLPKRGYDDTAPYSHASAGRSTVGSGVSSQSSHT